MTQAGSEIPIPDDRAEDAPVELALRPRNRGGSRRLPTRRVVQDPMPELFALAPAQRRRLRQFHSVRGLRSKVVLVAGLLAASTTLAFSLPPALESAPSAAVAGPPPQSITIVDAPIVPAPPRDSYTAVTPPPLQYPVPLGSAVASGYGPRSCAGCASSFHNGMDIFPGAGTPIRAMASGVVIKSNQSTQDSMGVMVEIEHVVAGETVTSIYGHLQAGSLTLGVGDQVYVGDVIGLVGDTGNAQGAHLHFEVHPGGGASVDPYAWLAARI